MTSDDDRRQDNLSTTQITLLHERLDNKSRRVARAMQFNIVAATAAVGVGQLAGGSVTVPVNATVTTGSAFLLVSFVAGFAGLAVVGHPLASAGRLPAPVDASRDRQATAPGGVVAELRRRNRAAAITQSLSFATGTLGVGLLLFGVVRSLGVTTDRLPFPLVVGGVFAVILAGHTVGHALAHLFRPLDRDEQTQ